LDDWETGGHKIDKSWKMTDLHHKTTLIASQCSQNLSECHKHIHNRLTDAKYKRIEWW